MILSRLLIVVIVILVTVLLAAGYIEQVGDTISAGNTTLPIPSISSIQTSKQIESHQIPNDVYWIKIGPISDKQVDDIFTIPSTTNMSAGEEILVQVYNSRIVRNISGTLGYY